MQNNDINRAAEQRLSLVSSSRPAVHEGAPLLQNPQLPPGIQQPLESVVSQPQQLQHQRPHLQSKKLVQLPPAKPQQRLQQQMSALQAGVPRAAAKSVEASVVKRLTPIQRKRKLHPTTRAVNPLPDSVIFQQLVAREREVDALIKMRQQEAALSAAPTRSITKKLRVYIYATHTNQPTSSHPGPVAPCDVPGQGNREVAPNASSEGGPPAWALHVHGRILEASGEVPLQTSLPTPQPFSHYLRSLTVKLVAVPVTVLRAAPLRKAVAPAPRAFGSKSRLTRLPQKPSKITPAVPPSAAVSPPTSEELLQQQPQQKDAAQEAGNNEKSSDRNASRNDRKEPKTSDTKEDVTTWSAAQQEGPPRSSFAIRRLGTTAMTARVTLDVTQCPQRYKCSPHLSVLIGAASMTRVGALQAVSSHVTRQGLETEGIITCDARLRAVVGQDRLPLSQLGEAVGRHLTPSAPLDMSYTIRLDGATPTVPDCYDIEIDVEAGPHSSAATSPAAPLLLRLDQKLDFSASSTKVDALTKRVAEHSRRRTLLRGFGQEPAAFLNGVIATQGRDLRQLPGEGTSEQQLYAPTRDELFHGRWVEDACLKCMRGN